jgi:predicted metalloprotease
MKMGGIGFFLLLLVVFFLSKGSLNLFDTGIGGGSTAPANERSTQAGTKDENSEFASVILASTEDAWKAIFRKYRAQYQAPKLVLFNGMVRSACGMTSSATGPFYCPGDHKLYIDLDFFTELDRMGARGDFAKAYVIAHEVGHHIQNLQGISMKVQNAQQRMRKSDANALSVLTELQADCYAGVWIHNYEKQYDILEKGDVEEGINAAASIGDDRMQSYAGQRVNPDGFTHGSSKQRAHWLKQGMLYGDVGKCDTFKQAGIDI